ncbi:CHAT domain-containing protein [candidate division KSB1 bacterium]|nr:CHAT domain-containing protein [candidate division KSB1 bacterium]
MQLHSKIKIACARALPAVSEWQRIACRRIRHDDDPNAAFAPNRMPQLPPILECTSYAVRATFCLLILFILFFNSVQLLAKNPQRSPQSAVLADSVRISELLQQAGDYVSSKRTREALEALNRSLQLAQKHDEPAELLKIYTGLGTICSRTGNLEAALEYFLRALQILPPTASSEQRFFIYDRLGELYLELSLLNKALHHFESAFASILDTDDSPDKMTNLAKQADVYFNLGQFSRALDLYLQAFTYAKLLKDAEKQIELFNKIGGIYFQFGDFQRAYKMYQNAFDKATEISDTGAIAKSLLNIGLIYTEVKDSLKASLCFSQAHNRFKQTGDSFGEAKTYRLTGDFLWTLGAYAKAIELYKRAQSLSGAFPHENEWGFNLIGLGNCNLKLGDAEIAASYFDEAIQFGETTSNQTIQWKAHFGKAQTEQLQGNYKIASSGYAHAISTIEKALPRIYTESDRAGFFENKIQIYQTYINLLTQLLDRKSIAFDFYAEEALHLIERSRARSYLESMVESRIFNKIKETIDEQRLQLLQINLDKQHQVDMAIKELLLKGDTPDSDEFSRLKYQRTQFEEELRTIQTEIYEAYPQIAQVEKIDPIDIDSLKAILSLEDRFLLEYMLGEDISYVWGVDKDRIYVAQLPPAAYIREQVEILLGGVSAPSDRISSLITKPGHRLYKILIEPMISRIKPNQKLLIIPDDVLHELPFEILLTSDYSDARVESAEEMAFLFERNPICYAPSATIFAYVAKQRASQRHHIKKLLAFGNPDFSWSLKDNPRANSILPGSLRGGEFQLSMLPWQIVPPLPFSREEVRRIGKMFEPGEATLLVGPEATENSLKTQSALREYRFIHFATHGIINENHPELSGLVLARDEAAGDDGILSIPEILNLKLQPDLVVLSTCQSARGKTRRGNGPESMTRAFMFAGAPSVVVSLWNIDDQSTADFMLYFYEFLTKSKQSKDTALKNAKIKMMKSQQYAHPFYWAAFILAGDSEGRYVRQN